MAINADASGNARERAPQPGGEPLQTAAPQIASFLPPRVQPKAVRTGGSRERNQRFASPLRARKINETEALRENVALGNLREPPVFTVFGCTRVERNDAIYQDTA
jgi:hypothetical protein